MLFNSYAFLFLFLPVTFLGFFQIGRYSWPLAALWLFAASLFFYGWWNPAYVGLLLASILFNYAVGMALSKEHAHGHVNRKKWILGLGIAADLGLLGYYKYANFFVENANTALNLGWQIEPIILPLGISFFTFTQIAFLVDAYRGEVKEANFIHYGLFVTYFPHLIAGPVLHHKEMMPQFALPATYRVDWENLSVGLTIFSIGLFKKVVLADGIAPFASSVFTAAADGGTSTFLEAWGGALAYTFQLYFDFSGYSDMAIGISRLFGVKLPLNFNSPYKAVNIIEFWRRWHMTLSRFLRDYLYFALGGNRKGPARRYFNLFATMLLGGLWHGAGWTFIMWGALHGLYLVINHAWHQVRKALGHDLKRSTSPGRFAGMTLTFLVVVIGWVFFRAKNFDAALSILSGMAGLNGAILPGSWYGLFHWRLVELMGSLGIHFGPLPAIDGKVDMMIGWIVALWALAWLAPNTQQIMANFKPALENVTPTKWLRWQPDKLWLTTIGMCLLYAVTEMGKVSEFLYFQF
ncbi:MBOAT family O-acyltransferase [Candidatus Nitrotoga sp. 1052]|uniref:MBOAT family O-acyltransferase n=1 Tax=Candidatus Nitrotoga sp. 1052 TaxID=2886964 RepID=UPI001EF42447|nr:MBOAT family protein [Candidatus Nitrotoga sp. 1052]CAH1073954.1 Peptidoglycan O-acetyltransferase [Candidatus Nitrotoga sp. 1052]